MIIEINSGSNTITDDFESEEEALETANNLDFFLFNDYKKKKNYSINSKRELRINDYKDTVC